ncbi:MAG: sugar transferase [Candidatus Magasanikbacteria bacterium]|nr:sugar transferase [Candidatus Magasanikbacteria bacterium]
MKRLELILMLLQVPVDLLMLLIAAGSAYLLRFSDWAVGMKAVQFDLSLTEFLSTAFPIFLVWLVIFAFTGLYNARGSKRFAQDVLQIILACSTGLAFVALYMLFFQQQFDSRFLLAATWVGSLVYVTAGRLIMRGVKGLFYRSGRGLKRVAIIGSDSVSIALKDVLSNRPELGYSVAASYASFSDNAIRHIRAAHVDELILTNPRSNEKDTVKAYEFAKLNHIGFKYSADMFATLSANMSVHPLGGIPMVEMNPTRLQGWGRILKRLFDIITSLTLLIILSPIYLITALVIKSETGTPIIYKNERVGVRGRTFFTLKFRSMFQKDSTGAQFGKSGKHAEDAEAKLIKKQNSKHGPIYKIKNDPRVTPFGRFIRKWSIDELPQFVNVLKGEMSIVGPRPHQPREVEKYDKEHSVVFAIKPGVTGLAQISGRSDLTFEEEMRLDTLYVERWSLWLDIIIFIKTPFILFKKRSVE